MQRTLHHVRHLSVRAYLVTMALLPMLPTAMAQLPGATSPSIANRAPLTASGQSATLLPDGRWLLLGGQTAGYAQNVARLFDPRVQETVTLSAGMAVARVSHTATVLPDGSVFIVGGFGGDGELIDVTERFDPATQAFTKAALSLSARALHTATLLTDGRLLIVGGVGANGEVRSDVEVVNTFLGAREQFDAWLETARFGHLAALLPSAPMQVWGGLDINNRPVESVEFFDPLTQRFAPLNSSTRGFLPDPLAAAAAPVVTGVLPDSSSGIAVDAVLTARFSKALDVTTLNAESVTLFGPRGPEAASVVAAEAGMLLFVTPAVPLSPGATYTLFISGARDNLGLAMPLVALPFHTGALLASSPTRAVPLAMPEADPAPVANVLGTTEIASSSNPSVDAAASPSIAPTSAEPAAGVTTQSKAIRPISSAPPDESDEAWVPGEAAFAGNWRSKREAGIPALKALAAVEGLIAPEEVTAVSGQVLRLNGQPLASAAVSMNGRVTYTDGKGRFLLSNVQAGWQSLSVDGASANRPDAKYGQYDMRVHVTAGRTNALVWTVWMTKLDTAHVIRLDSPTQRETILSTPLIPGLEFKLPAGTVIRDRAGKIVTELTITPVPIDQTAHPLPDGGFPVYFTMQPTGLRFESADGTSIQPVRLRYPNYDSNLAPGSPATFWSYDPGANGWETYATGVVTHDNYIEMPGGDLNGIRIWTAMGWASGPVPGPLGPPCHSCPCTPVPGDPPPPPGPPGGPMLGNPDGPTSGFPGGDDAGDPCSIASGQFTLTSRDLGLRDIIPIDVTRVYRPNDTRILSFGIGTSWSLGMYIYTDTAFVSIPLVMANGTRIYFDNVNGVHSANGGVFVNSTTPGAFFGAVLTYTASPAHIVTILRKDGTRYTFDVYGTLIEVRNRNGVAVGITSATGKISHVASPSGRWFDVTYAGSLITQIKDHIGRAVTYGYTSNRLTSVTNANGDIWTYSYDPNGRMKSVTDPRHIVMVTNTYDANGRISAQTYADSSTMQFAYVLDTAGNVTQTNVTDRNGNVRRVQLDAAGDIQQDTFPVGAPEQQVFTFTRDPTSHLLTSTTDAFNRRTAFTYDAKGNTLTTTRLAGTVDAVTTIYAYEPTFNRVATIEDPLTQVTTLAYDSFGNLTQLIDPLSHTTTMTYDSLGQLVTITNALNFATTYTYDAGTLTSVTDPLYRTTTMFSDAAGRMIRVVDPLGNTSTTQYDALDRITTTTDALGNVVRYEYDANGNLTAHVDQKGNRTEYTFDAMNRLASRRDALLQTESYIYDVASRLSRFTDRKSQVSGFTYDALNRRTQAGFGATIGSPTAYSSTIGYVLDAGNRLTQATDSQNGIITRSYDGLDRLTSETTALAAVAFTYDAAGRRLTRTVPGQATLTYAWDNANRLSSLTQGTQSVAITYDDANRRTQVILPNGIAINSTFDAASQLTGIIYQQGATTLGDLTFAYDAAGRRINIAGSFARTDLPTAIATAAHNAANQLTQWGVPTLAYDLNGNLTTDGAYSYTWNSRNQLIQLQQGATTIASYQYDAFGRRQQKVVNGITTQFVYDGQNFVQERDGTNNVIANLLTGLRMDEVYARSKGAITSSFLTDHLGTIIAEADSAGLIQTTYSYEPYGKTNQIGAASDNSQRYTGREQEIADLYYYRARYFSTNFGRFNSGDPLGLLGGTNGYAYVNDDPVDYIDPDGLKRQRDQRGRNPKPGDPNQDLPDPGPPDNYCIYGCYPQAPPHYNDRPECVQVCDPPNACMNPAGLPPLGNGCYLKCYSPPFAKNPAR